MAVTERAVAILADVHGIREVVVAGDLVGFGASPNAVVDWLVAHGATLVLGNHEAEYVADTRTRQTGRPGVPTPTWRACAGTSTASAPPARRC